MKIKIFFCGIVAASIILVSCGKEPRQENGEDDKFQLYNGGVSSNGGASLLDADNPWFVGDEPISYCIERSSFSVDDEALAKLVSESIDSWVATTISLKGNERTYEFPDGVKRAMSTNFVYKNTCTEDVRLRFAFGLERIPSWGVGSNRIGEVLRAPIDLQTGKTNGIVWISPDQGEKKILQECDSYWSLLDKNPLANVLMHELGHVFGFSHSVMPFAHFMNEEAPGKILGWLADECRGNGPNWQGERVTSDLFVDRLSFFTGNSHMGKVIDDRSWLREQLGFSECGEMSSSALIANTTTVPDTDIDLTDMTKEKHKEVFEVGAFQVDFDFTYCNNTQNLSAKFIPDEASRFNHSALVTGDYIHQQDTNQWQPHAEYILTVGQYGASGILELENGVNLPAYLEARSDNDRFLTLTFQSDGIPHIEILLRDRIVYGFANVAYRIE